jgi:hypothetical protein
MAAMCALGTFKDKMAHEAENTTLVLERSPAATVARRLFLDWLFLNQKCPMVLFNLVDTTENSKYVRVNFLMGFLLSDGFVQLVIYPRAESAEQASK